MGIVELLILHRRRQVVNSRFQNVVQVERAESVADVADGDNRAGGKALFEGGRT